ncbi:MAG: efflux RND transporter periplasmic adaptor subunit [Selenomonadaceae bacterium]|nr:efflux RND transporter periplasmic adaptor subunit [Selenomonadaceae bacterium]
MKKPYMIGIMLIISFAVAMVAYGAWLNKTGENKIAERIENRTIPLQGAKAEYRNMHPQLVLETLNLYSEDMADAVALIDGRIEQVAVKKNSSVRHGQVLFTLVNEEIPLKIQQAESSIAKAEAQLANAKNNFARYTRLRERDATSIEKYDEAEAMYLAAEASLKEAHTVKEQLLVQSARQDVTAPIDGEVLILYRQEGAYVTAGTPLALVGNFSRLFFSMPMEDKYAQRMKVGNIAELSFRNNQIIRKAYDTEYAAGNEGASQDFTVKINEIMPALNEPAKLRKVVFEIDNRVGLLEQQAYSGALLKSLTSEKYLSVPLAAMIDASRSAVFVVKSDNTLERREVESGVDDGSYVEITHGLKEGETVITSAAEGLEAGMKVTVNLIGDDGK